MTIDITAIVEAVIALAVALISAFVIPWLKTKIGVNKMADFLKWVEIAVAAAEQLYNSTECSAKKYYVESFMLDKGYSVSSAELDTAIEGAVKKLHAELYGSTKDVIEE